MWNFLLYGVFLLAKAEEFAKSEEVNYYPLQQTKS